MTPINVWRPGEGVGKQAAGRGSGQTHAASRYEQAGHGGEQIRWAASRATRAASRLKNPGVEAGQALDLGEHTVSMVGLASNSNNPNNPI